MATKKTDMLIGEVRKFCGLIESWLLERGATRDDTSASYRFIVATVAGPLHVSVWEDAGDVCCRFDDAAKASATFRGLDISNPSGKWNHHVLRRYTADQWFRHITAQLSYVLPSV